MVRYVSYLVLFLILSTGIVFAQFGKISGRVVDKETREPLVGANIQVVATALGTTSDADGRYTILRVPPGRYDVKATYIGYQDVTVTNVEIISDLTATMDFDLATTAIEVQPVTIVAERPLIEKSATNAIRVFKAEDLVGLPVRGFVAYSVILPGVVFQNDRIHVRGGRADEVGYNIEGATTTNIMSRDGGTLIATVPNALEEITVQAGGYNAEYGGANAGIVSQNLRTGKERYQLMVQAETDNFGNYPGEKFLDTYSYGYTDLALTASGPVYTDKLRFFIGAQNEFMRDYTPAFWSGSPARWSDGEAVGRVFDTGARGGDVTESQILRWDPANIPGRMRNRYSLNGTLLFDFKPYQVKIGGLYTWQRTRRSAATLINLFNQDRLPVNDESSGLITGTVSYFLTDKSLIEAKVNYLDRREKTYDPIFNDDLLSYTDSVKAAERGWKYPSYASQPVPYDFYGFSFNRPGTNITSYMKNQTGYIGGTLAYTSQVGNHEIKAGVGGEFWTTRNYSIVAGARGIDGLLQFLRANPDSARVEAAFARIVRRQTSPNIYGYDEFGRVLNNGGLDGPKKPTFVNAYVQDKIEFDDLVINAGLRYDRIDMDSWRFLDPSRPKRDDEAYTLKDIETMKAFQYLSPRLGFSFPVTDRTVFHLQYGKFVQAPSLDVAYRGVPAAVQQIIGGFFFGNPIAYGLEPTRTTQYEIGFTHQFTDFAAFDITGFYKDIKGQVQYDFVQTVAGYDPSIYYIYTNGDFATTKGLEFRLTLRRVSRVQGFLNYTLSDARGTNSFPNSAGGALNVIGIRPTTISPLAYDQTHRGSINVDYRFGKDDGGPILERLGANVLFTFTSGHRYTKATVTGLGQQDASLGGILNDTDPRQRNPREPINSSTTPFAFELALRVDKTVSIANVDLNFYVYIQNLLNTKNVTNVYYATGNAFDDGFLTNPENQSIIRNLGSRYVDLYRVINLENRQHNTRLNGFDLFGTPRQIRLGLRLEI